MIADGILAEHAMQLRKILILTDLKDSTSTVVSDGGNNNAAAVESSNSWVDKRKIVRLMIPARNFVHI